MLQLLYDYYQSLFGLYFSYSDFYLDDLVLTIGNNDTTMGFSEYLALICSIVSLIIILVLCCLFIYRLIRVVGRLFMGA